MQEPKLSILMSTYGETESHIREAVESLLCQSFSEYELIVINDNPNRTDIKSILDSYGDSRIRFYQNSSNIGLAMSMNKAARMALTDIFARMDADDIALPQRIEKQYKEIQKGFFDFVFSDFNYIDEKSNLVEGRIEHPYYSPEELNFILTKDNVIHHPTVMFTRSIFEKVGGYRDFPCSQDADLWFRMHEAGCRFLMLKDKLLQYRINSNSISNKRWFQQQLTCNYIFDLSIERLKRNGNDSFSQENYSIYLSKWDVGNPQKASKLRRDYRLLSRAAKCKFKGRKIYALFIRLWVFISSRYMRNHILQVKRKTYLLKRK